MRLRRGRARSTDPRAAAFHAAARPAVSTPWRAAGWCAVDLELTGLDPRRGEIIALGAVPIEDGRLQFGSAHYALARPSTRPDHDAVLTHKLRLDDLLDAPPVADAIDALMELMAGRIPVFHVEAVERTFLTPLLAQRGVRLPAAADTEVLGRVWLRRRDGVAPPGLALAALAQALGQPAEPPHHALGDALTTAQAFIALASHLDAIAPQTVGSLVHAGELLGGGRRFTLS